jgi:hypothetical protein
MAKGNNLRKTFDEVLVLKIKFLKDNIFMLTVRVGTGKGMKHTNHGQEDLQKKD